MVCVTLVGCRVGGDPVERSEIRGFGSHQHALRQGFRKGKWEYLAWRLPGTAERAAKVLEGPLPHLRLSRASLPPFGFENNELEMAGISIVAARPARIVFCAFGFPRTLDAGVERTFPGDVVVGSEGLHLSRGTRRKHRLG